MRRRTQSSWIIDGCAWYVASEDGIWSNWVAGDSMRPPEVPAAHTLQIPYGHGQELTCQACETEDQKQQDHRRMRPACRGSGWHLLSLGSRWCYGSHRSPRDPCFAIAVLGSTRARPRIELGAMSLRTKSSWIIDGCARYVAVEDGIWSNWVAGDFMGSTEVPEAHAFEMLSRETCRHG